MTIDAMIIWSVQCLALPQFWDTINLSRHPTEEIKVRNHHSYQNKYTFKPKYYFQVEQDETSIRQ